MGNPEDGADPDRRTGTWRRFPLLLLIGLLALKAVSLVLEDRTLRLALVPTGLVLLELFALRWASRRRSGGMLRGLLGALVCLVGMAMVAFVAMTIWVDRGLAQRPGLGEPAGRIWSTRGLALEGPEITRDGTQNSVGAVRLAFERGAAGVEVDVFYDPEMADFVVSHDRPYNPKDGKLLMLGELLDSLQDFGDRAYWLDWKKLRHLADDELASALTLLAELCDRYTLWDRFFVEGEDPFHLTECRRRGFKTIIDSHPLPDGHLVGGLVLDFYRALYYLGEFTVLGLPGGDRGVLVYGPHTAAALSPIPAFVYHVPSEEARLETLLASPAVRVVLLRDQSDDRFRAASSAR